MHAELIIYNGTIYTMDSLHPTAEAVAVADGRILAVGQLEHVEATAHANTRRLNLAGRTLIPGFNDACAHLWEVGSGLIGANPAEPTDADYEAAILAAAKAYLRYGVTSVTDSGVTPAQLETYRRLAAERRMPFRINVIQNRYTADGVKIPLPERFESNWLRVDTVRLVADADMVDAANTNLRYTRDQMRGMIWDIHRAGLRASVQASGETAIEQVIEAMEYASKRLVSRMKHRLEQFVLPSADHVNRCRYRISVAMLPSRIPALAHLPADLVSRLYPVRAVLDAGLMAAFGSGATDEADINPVRGLLAAATRVATEDTPDQAVPVSDTIPLYTLGSAVIAGEDYLKGSIAPGKYADLAVLSGDPLRAPIDRVSDLTVELTLVNGQVLYTA